MHQEFEYENYVDENGNPSGGYVTGKGLKIDWQDGPLAVDGNRLEPNGCFVETLLDVAKIRLMAFQDSKFHSQYNHDAIEAIQLAINALDQRTKDRESRGVEGTHNV